MVHFGVHFQQTPSTLVVNDPVSVLALLMASAWTLLPIYNVFVERPLRRTKLIVHVVIAVVVFAFAPGQTRLTLDRQTQTGSLRSFYFYHFYTKTFPLSSLESASIRSGDTTDRILLQFSDGDTESMSFLNQIGGKDQAVFAINHFLAGDVSTYSR